MKSKPETAVHVGKVLLSATPFAFVLKSNLRNERCNYCFKRTKVLRCSGCQYVYYCTRECQKNAWTEHKFECSYLKKVAHHVVPDAAHLMARIILKLERGGDQEKGYYSENGFRKFKDLMSHYSDLKKDMKRMEHFSSLHGVLLDMIGENNLPNTAELMGIYGRICVNGFNILDPEMLSIGTGIYLSPSIIDHSCDPNAVAVFEGTTLHIRATKPMPALDWKKVRITYIDLLNPTQARRAELEKGYYFLCDCSRCLGTDEQALMNSVLCPNTACQKPMPVSPDVKDSQTCTECNYFIKADTLKEYQEVTEFTQQQLEIMKDIAYLDVCKVCLKKQHGLFHPLNILHVKVLDLAFESSIEMAHWDLACEFGKQLGCGYRKYYGDLHPLTGIYHMKLGKLLLYQQKPKEAWEHLVKARNILQVTHGERHTLCCEDLTNLMLQTNTEMENLP